MKHPFSLKLALASAAHLEKQQHKRIKVFKKYSSSMQATTEQSLCFSAYFNGKLPLKIEILLGFGPTQRVYYIQASRKQKAIISN